MFTSVGMPLHCGLVLLSFRTISWPAGWFFTSVWLNPVDVVVGIASVFAAAAVAASDDVSCVWCKKSFGGQFSSIANLHTELLYLKIRGKFCVLKNE